MAINARITGLFVGVPEGRDSTYDGSMRVSTREMLASLAWRVLKFAALFVIAMLVIGGVAGLFYPALPPLSY
jgi:hypothetical protein